MLQGALRVAAESDFDFDNPEQLWRNRSTVSHPGGQLGDFNTPAERKRQRARGVRATKQEQRSNSTRRAIAQSAGL